MPLFLAGNQLGAIVFKAADAGPTLFSCPVFLRGAEMSMETIQAAVNCPEADDDLSICDSTDAEI